MFLLKNEGPILNEVWKHHSLEIRWSYMNMEKELFCKLVKL